MQLTSKIKAIALNLIIGIAIFAILFFSLFPNAFAETIQYNNHFTSIGQGATFLSGTGSQNGSATIGEFLDPTADYNNINAVQVRIVCEQGTQCNNVNGNSWVVNVFETTNNNTLGALVATSKSIDSSRIITYATSTGTYFSPQNFFATTSLATDKIFTQFDFTTPFNIENSKKYIILVSWNGSAISNSASIIQTSSGAGRWTSDPTPNTADVTTTSTTHSMSYRLISDANQYTPETQPVSETTAMNIFSPNKMGSPYATSTPLTFWMNTRKSASVAQPLYPCFTLKRLSTSFLTLEIPDIDTFCKDVPIEDGQNTSTLQMTVSDISTYLEIGKTYGAFPFLSTSVSVTDKYPNSDGTPTVFSVGRLANDLEDFYVEFVNATTTPQGWSCEVDVVLVGFDVCEVAYYLIIPAPSAIQSSLDTFQAEFETRVPFAYMSDIQTVFGAFWNLNGDPIPPTLEVVLWKDTDPITILGTDNPFYPDPVRKFFRDVMSAGLYVGLLFAIFSLIKKIFNSSEKK